MPLGIYVTALPTMIHPSLEHTSWLKGIDSNENDKNKKYRKI